MSTSILNAQHNSKKPNPIRRIGLLSQ